MIVENLKLDGLKLITLQVFKDKRGFFYEGFNVTRYYKAGITKPFVQDNVSFSRYGTIRGMHYQVAPEQGKLISVLDGKIFDVCVDIRPESVTFGQWLSIVLDANEPRQLYIPGGFAHGFCCLSETCQVCYKVDTEYNPSAEKGFCYDDETLNISWPLSNPILSEKDQKAPSFKEAVGVVCSSG